VADSLPDVRDLLKVSVEAIGGTERPGQVQMADAVYEAIQDGAHLFVQAGTGTGKSLAYLTAAMRHAYEGEVPVIVATATLALQAQLVDRDLPRLVEAVTPLLGRRPYWAAVKGRANYACLHRIWEGIPNDEGALVPVSAVGPVGAEVARARVWAEKQAAIGGAGDRDHLTPGVSDRAWAQVSISARECMGAASCPYGTQCFTEVARRKAREADIVVTNHALLAIDATEGFSILPEHDAVIIDEAHELVARVTSVATKELSPGAVDRAAKRARPFTEEEQHDALVGAAEGLRDALGTTPAGRIDTMPEYLATALARVRDTARAVQSAFRPVDELSPDRAAARHQAQAGVDEVFSIAERMAQNAGHDVVWLEHRERFGELLHVAPLSVSDLLRDKLFAHTSVVLTSATLAIGGTFDAVARSMGVERDEWHGVDVGSPFDYPRQAMLYCARHLPTPGRDGITDAVLDEIADLVEAAGGRTLGLFSSRRAAEQAAEAMRERLTDVEILCQGEDLVPTLVREFIAKPASCLFGTLSLWQGVDVPGDACHLVIIDRLPFPRPDDPLLSARQRAVDRAGGNGFMSVAATHAGLLLAQGAGRLIRRASDRGVVAVLDPRLATARYGDFLRRSLPPMWLTANRETVLAALRRLDADAAAVRPEPLAVRA
jgi:ATP-dependent DNA helicase DinG